MLLLMDLYVYPEVYLFNICCAQMIPFSPFPRFTFEGALRS